MQIIYKIDVLFIVIYSFLVLVIGTVFSIASKNMISIAGTLLVEMIYLFFALKKPYRRLKASQKPMPEEWKEILTLHSAFYRNSDEQSRQRFEKDIRIFLGEYSIEGIRRQEIDMQMKLLVASGFATLLNGRPDWEPPIKDGVLVYPGTRFNRDYKIGRGNFAGQATVNSPLIVTEESLEQSFIHPEDGYNVIFHEVAHYLDMEDGRPEGIPASRIPPEELPRWKNIIHNEWKKANRGRSFLGSYAGTNEAELFAVAVEFFFENPQLMKTENSQLYDILKDFFNIDTLKIMTGRGTVHPNGAPQGQSPEVRQ